jgi:hypothetical protein
MSEDPVMPCAVEEGIVGVAKSTTVDMRESNRVGQLMYRRWP